MGMFFKKKIIGQYPHEVLRKDWENVMDALFRNTIANNAKGVAIICNTNRQDPTDGAGTVQQELVYHIRKQRIDEVTKKSGFLSDKKHTRQRNYRLSSGAWRGQKRSACLRSPYFRQ